MRDANAGLAAYGLLPLRSKPLAPRRPMPVHSMKTKDSDALDHVKTALELAKAGLTGIGIPGVEAIAAVPLELIAIFETVKTNKEDLRSLLSHLSALERAILAPLEEARQREGFHVPDDIRVRLEKLTQEFTDFGDALGPFKNLGFWRRLLRRGRIAAALQEASRNISQVIAAFQLGTQITVELLVQGLRENVQKIDERVQEHDDKSILSELRPVHGGFNVSEKTGCLANTREQLLSDIRHDLSRPELMLVCLYGSPGTGKSAVAKSIATALRAQGDLAASYFFDKSSGDAKNVTVTKLISTLCYEFALVNPDFRAAVVAQLKEDPSLASANRDTRFEKLFLTPVCHIPTPHHPFVIVLDALDECGGPDAQKALAELLRRCAESSELRSHITFFLTSRPEPAITDALSRQALAPFSASYWMNELGEDQTRADIVLFVEDGFRKLIGEIKKPSTLPQRDEVVRFAGLSAGLFEIAALLLRQLSEYCEAAVSSLNDGIVRIHDLVRTSSPNLQLTLPAIYSAILKGAYVGLSKWYPQPTILADYRTVVGALACLRQPLSTAVLSRVLNLEVASIVRLLRPLGSVIAAPDDGPIYFFHASFLDFILSEPDSYGDSSTFLSPYLISPVASHTTLAKRSLTIMNELLRRNILSLADPSVYNDEMPDLPSALAQHAPLHLRYACLYWVEHLRKGDVLDCRDVLAQWCNEQMMYYLEMLSLLGELERAVPLLMKAEDCVQKGGQFAATATILNDCQRLVQMFHPAIAEKASAVYSSAIPFMPSCHLHKRYARLADGELTLVRGRLSAWPAQIWAANHPDKVRSVAFSPDGRRIASGCSDGLIRILSATTGRTEQLLKGHGSWVLSVAYSPDGQRLVSGSQDGSVRLWSIATGEQERVLEMDAGSVRSVAFSPDGARIASGSIDCAVRVWSVATGEQERVLRGHAGQVQSVTFSPDGTRILSGAHDQSARVWSVVTGEQELLLAVEYRTVGAVAFSPDGAHVVSGRWIWSAVTGEHEQALDMPVGGRDSLVTSIAYSPDGAHIVRGSYGGLVCVWSAANGTRVRVLEGHTSSATSVAFSPDGARIVSGSDDGSVCAWSFAAGEQEQVLNGHTHYVNCVAFSSDRSRIVTASNDSSVRVWSTVTGEQELVFEGRSGGLVIAAAISPDGAHIVSAGYTRSVYLWSAVTGEVEQELEQPRPGAEMIKSLAFSSDGKRIVCGTQNGWLGVWSAVTGEAELILEGHTLPVYSVAFSPDSSHIVSGSNDRSVRIWSAVSGEEERVLQGHTLHVTLVTFSSDGRTIKAIDRGGSALFWDVESGLKLEQSRQIRKLNFPEQVGAFL